MPARRVLPDACLAWLRANDEWVEIEAVCEGVGNTSKESVRHALDKLVSEGLAVKRVPMRRPGLRVTYRAIAVVDRGVRLEICWPHPIRRR